MENNPPKKITEESNIAKQYVITLANTLKLNINWEERCDEKSKEIIQIVSPLMNLEKANVIKKQLIGLTSYNTAYYMVGCHQDTKHEEYKVLKSRTSKEYYRVVISLKKLWDCMDKKNSVFLAHEQTNKENETDTPYKEFSI